MKKKHESAPILIELIDPKNGHVYYKSHYWTVPEKGGIVTYKLGKRKNDWWLRIKWD